MDEKSERPVESGVRRKRAWTTTQRAWLYPKRFQPPPCPDCEQTEMGRFCLTCGKERHPKRKRRWGRK